MLFLCRDKRRVDRFDSCTRLRDVRCRLHS
nr:MAG TPA: hypothetical protein [Caudoviricetes sp.]